MDNCITLDNIKSLDWSKRPDGLMPVITQDAQTQCVLMEGYTDQAGLTETLECGKVVFYSRSRQGRWLKGETSGNFLLVAPGETSIRCDCDRDAILILVNPVGPTCHTNTTSCFGDCAPSGASKLLPLTEFEGAIKQRVLDSSTGSDASALFQENKERISQRVVEKASDLADAAVNGDKGLVIEKGADLLCQTMELLCAAGIELSQVATEIGKRNASRPTKGTSAALPVPPPP